MLPMMDDVLRLTKAGRLRDATVRLTEGLAGVSATGKARPTPHPQEEARDRLRGPDILDAAPPSRQGDAWTVSAPPVDAPVAQAATFGWHGVENAAGRRRYKLFVPEGDGVAPRPLLLMLHGCTQSPDDFAAGTRMNSLAGEKGLLVAYPEQTAAHNASKCWNWFRTEDQRRDAGEPGLLAAVVADVARTHRIDASRVFVAGLSAGGAAAAVLAQTYPDIFRGVGIHSGLACGAARDLPSALVAMKRGAPARCANQAAVPCIVFHGGADKTVHPDNARHVVAGIASSLGTPTVTRGRTAGGASYAREVWRDEGERSRAELWTIDGAGHAWAGGSPEGSYTDPRGPDATREFVRFFLDLQ